MDTATPETTAPATSGAPTSGDRPMTMHAAFAANPVTVADTSSPEVDPSTDAQTAQPADATAPPVTAPTEVKGPIPFDRHKAILDNAYKERDDLKAQVASLTQQASSPDQQRLRQWGEAFARNPEQWFAQTVQELQALHPELTPALRSHAARLLGSRQSAPQALEPDIPVYDEHGQMVAQTFSAPRVQQIVQQAIAEALQKEVGPIRQDFQQRQEREQIAQMKSQADSAAAEQFKAATEWPGFLTTPGDPKSVDPDVAKAFQEHPDWSLERCYIATVVPKLRQQEQAQVIQQLKTKAAAGNTVNPAGPVVASTRKPTSLLDPSLSWS